MLVDMGLDEQGVLLGVQAAGDVLGQLLQGPAAQGCRVLADGDGVQVGHKIEALILIGTLGPVLHRAQVASQGQIAAGLDAGEHPLFLNLDFFHK